jgi:hypothetical protein
MFNLAKEFVVYSNSFWWKLHGRGMLLLQSSEHDVVCDKTKLGQSQLSLLLGSSLRDWIENFFVEDRDVVETRVRAFSATALLIRGPLKLRAWTLFTEIAGKGPHLQEAQE